MPFFSTVSPRRPFSLTAMSKIILLAATLLATSFLQAQAQVGAPGSTGPGPQQGPTTTPIDGGASLLLAAGLAYGRRRLRQRAAQRP